MYNSLSIEFDSRKFGKKTQNSKLSENIFPRAELINSIIVYFNISYH